MKKIFTLLFAATLMAGNALAQKVTEVTVTKKAELTAAINDAATLSPGDTARIYISGVINLGSFTFPETTRTIHFIGVNDEETGAQSALQTELYFPSNESEADKFGLIFENLRLEDYRGVWGGSKHFINFKDNKQHFVDIFALRNCEITNICRSFLRGQIDKASEVEGYKGCGVFNKFEMTNCTFHNGSRASDAMPLIYMAWSTNEMVFRNNTFYDLTNLNSLVTFNYMTDDTGRQAIKFVFENNTLVAWAKSTLFNFGQYVTTESEFHIKNNIFLFPNWTDECNNRVGDSGSNNDMSESATQRDEEGNTTFGYLTDEEIAARIEKGTVLTNILGGLVQQENNLMLGFKYQNMADAIDAGDIIPIGDDETEEAEFSSYAMEDVPFAWTDFADVKNDFFQINYAAPAYKAGKNGAPLGDVNNYTDKVIKVVSITTHVEGSKSASVIVSPTKDAYMSGDVVTLTANVNGSLNTFKGWSNGMTEPVIEVTLEDDLDITANFEEIDYIAVWNLDQVTTNNVVIAPPAKPNHGNMALTLDYARFIIPEVEEGEEEVEEPAEGAYFTGAEGAIAYDGAKAAIQTRNNKVSGDLRNCFLITTPTTQFTTEGGGKADYLLINVPEALENTKLQFYVASDNIPYKTYAISYSADGTEWTDIATFDMTDRTGTDQWYLVSTELPTLAAGSMLRIKGVESEGMFINADFQALIDAGTQSITTEYLFVAEIILMPASTEGIAEVNSGNDKLQNAPVYNLMGIRVNGQAKGLLIQNGKKYIVK